MASLHDVPDAKLRELISKWKDAQAELSLAKGQVGTKRAAVAKAAAELLRADSTGIVRLYGEGGGAMCW